jgi:CheY-like chemotaxis protein
VFDLGLPDGNGKDVIRQVREWSDVPMIVISARDREGGSRAVIVAFLFSIYDLIMVCVWKSYASMASYFAAASAGVAVAICSGGNRLTNATSNETSRTKTCVR